MPCMFLYRHLGAHTTVLHLVAECRPPGQAAASPRLSQRVIGGADSGEATMPVTVLSKRSIVQSDYGMSSLHRTRSLHDVL